MFFYQIFDGSLQVYCVFAEPLTVLGDSLREKNL